MPLFRKEYRHALSEPFEMVLKDRTFAESRTCIYVFLHTDFRYGLWYHVRRKTGGGASLHRKTDRSAYSFLELEEILRLRH